LYLTRVIIPTESHHEVLPQRIVKTEVSQLVHHKIDSVCSSKYACVAN